MDTEEGRQAELLHSEYGSRYLWLKISFCGQYCRTRLAALSISMPGPVSKLTMYYLMFDRLVDSRMILGLTSLLCSMNSLHLLNNNVKKFIPSLRIIEAICKFSCIKLFIVL